MVWGAGVPGGQAGGPRVGRCVCACALGAGGQCSYEPSCPVTRLFSALTPKLPGGQAAPPHIPAKRSSSQWSKVGLEALRPCPQCHDLGQGCALRPDSVCVVEGPSAPSTP